MAKKTRIKAKEKEGIVTVKALASHPMISSVEAENNGKEVNFITYLYAKANGKIVFEVATSQSWSKDPYIKFSFRGAKKGDELEITWVDLKGEKQTSTTKIK